MDKGIPDATKYKFPVISLHVSDAKSDDMMCAPEIELSEVLQDKDGIVDRMNLHAIESLKPEDSNRAEHLRKNLRTRIQWDEKELSALLQGVGILGEGNWTDILSTYSDAFKTGRRVVDLITKYRQYIKASSFYTTPKRAWVELDESLNPEIDSKGNEIVCTEKFPYDAAKKLVKRRGLSDAEFFRITLAEKDDLSKIHSYGCNVENSKIRLRKLSPKAPSQQVLP